MTQISAASTKLSELSQAAQDKALENLLRQLITCLGENPDAPTLQDTPRRARELWRFWTSGYGQSPADILAPRPTGASTGNVTTLQPDSPQTLLRLNDIPVFTHCEQHLTPISGVAHVAYIPSHLTTDIHRLPRLVDAFARRLQSQERLTHEVADALYDVLKPAAVAVKLICRHTSMEGRGMLRHGGCDVTTAALRGQWTVEPF